MMIMRVWAEQEKTPNPIARSGLQEEIVAQIVDVFPDVHYFFMEEDDTKLYLEERLGKY